MQLVVVFAVIAALGSGEWSLPSPAEDVVWKIYWSLLSMAMVVGAAVLGTAAFANRPRAFRSYQRLHVVLWLTGAGAVLWAFEWPRIIRYNADLLNVFLIDDLLLVAPVLAPLFLSWVAFGLTPSGQSPEASPSETFLRAVRFTIARVQGELAPILLPALAMLIVCDAVRLFLPMASDGAGWVIDRWMIYAAAAVAIALAMPMMLARVWRTERLPSGELQTRLKAAAQDLGVRFSGVRIWRTDAFANAAVCGVGPWRTFFLTSALMRLLDDCAVEAIFRHEAAHVRSRHALFRVITSILPLLLYLNAVRLTTAWCGELHGAADATFHAVAALLTAIYLGLFFGWVARRFEHEADVVAAASSPDGPEPLLESLRDLNTIAGEDPARATWLHPSLLARTRVLTGAHPQQIQIANGRIRATLLLVLVLLAAALGWG